MTDENDRWSMRGAGTPLGDRTITVREDKAPTKSAGGGKKFNSTVLGDSGAGVAANHVTECITLFSEW